VSYRSINASFRKPTPSLSSGFLYCTTDTVLYRLCNWKVGRNSVVGIATRYWLDVPRIETPWGRDFFTHPDRPCVPSSLPHNGYRVSLPGVKRLGRGGKERVELSSAVLLACSRVNKYIIGDASLNKLSKVKVKQSHYRP
jgi:hypothetical protein